MLVKDVAKLSSRERFWYWARERHAIYLRRKMGKPKPWTDDEVLQSFFFTNPYRENDKVTVWFRENVREPLRDRPEVIFATVCFRWFNLPEPTGRILMTPKSNAHTNFEQRKTLTPLGKLMLSSLCDWDAEAAFSVLDAVRKEGGQIFTGAFMVNSPPGKGKLEAIVERITNVWDNREGLLMMWEGRGRYRLEDVHKALTVYPGLGGFMAYEVVTDLRHTAMLDKAPDIMTWCNPGPGCIRGLCRVFDIPFEKGNNSTSPPKPKGWEQMMAELLAESRIKLRGMPPWEMRELEHSLCEADKYSRALEGDGKLKRRYKGG